jgi:hypothetical protein
MSKAFVQSFFPAFTSLVDAYVPAVSQLLLPDDVAELCPEPTVHVTFAVLHLLRELFPLTASYIVNSNNSMTAVVRNPVLALASIVGIAIGFGGARRYYHWHHYDYDAYTSNSILWSVAYACFGLMNVVALPLHCLVEVDSTTDKMSLPIQYPWLWVLDCFLTGASSLAIILASVSVYYQHRRRIFPTKWWVSSSTNSSSSSAFLQQFKYEPTMYSWICWNSIGVTSIACFLCCSSANDQPQYEITSMAKTLPLELWYLVPTAMAGHVLFPLLFLLTSSEYHKDRWSGAFCCIVGAAFVVLGLALDATLCRWTQGALTWDGLYASTLTFWGCDIAFYGMGLWLDTALFARSSMDRKRQ